MPYIFTKDIAGFKKGDEFHENIWTSAIWLILKSLLIDNGTLVEQGKEERWKPEDMESLNKKIKTDLMALISKGHETVINKEEVEEYDVEVNNFIKNLVKEVWEAAAERVRKALKGE
jgi:hypothetical protein